MDILAFIPVYERRDITRICYTGLERIRRATQHNVEVLIVASTEEDKALAEEYGYNVCYTDNRPLGRKFNAGALHALGFDFDYLLQLNSDDLLSTDFWERINVHLSRRFGFFGVDQLYFIDSKTKKIRHFRYPLGCGLRFIRRDVLELAGLTDSGFNLWDDRLNAGLDNNSDDNILLRTNFAQRFIRTSVEEKPIFLDIKSETNIHKFEEFSLAPSVTGSEYRQVFRRFPELSQLR